MREFFKMFFASILAMVVGSVVMLILVAGVIGGIASAIKDKEDPEITGNVLTIDLSQHIYEINQNNALAILSDETTFKAGLYDLCKALDRAKTDKNIKGVVLKLNSGANGYATLQQLRMALNNFKSSGKFIIAYGEDISQSAYYMGSVADSIYLNPAGSLEHKGYATTLAFFKGTLDKLELQPEIFYAGKFKSATEPFRADKMSAPNREQIGRLQNNLWDEYLNGISQYAHQSKNTLMEYATKGTIQFPSDAYQYKMVTGLKYWDEVETVIKQKAGYSADQTIKYATLSEYATSNRVDDNIGEQKIALLIAEGEIVDGEQKDEHQIASKTFCEEIRKIAKNNDIKAVVLRINSPGGSAMASEIILRELKLLQQKKKLVVSMGDYAASGGYYIATMADSIFALPNTITGSIGVFGMMFNLDKLMKNKLGITFDGVKNAPFADFPTAFRPMTAEEGKRMQTSIDTIYAKFKNHVATGRKLQADIVDSIAQGRVWTGTDALSIGLVDKLGTMQQAINSAASLAKLSKYRVVTYPEPIDKFNLILKKFKSNTEAQTALRQALKAELGSEQYSYINYLAQLQHMNGKAMMALPFVIRTY